MNLEQLKKTSETRIERFLRHMSLSLGIGLLSTFIVASVSGYLPQFLAGMLNLPGLIFCYFLITYETKPIDDVPLFEAGQYALCYFVGVLLNVPYYTLLACGAIRLFEIRRDED
ncbi:MAG TPA: hypothetical protein VGW12_08450 [Pyrinomonadaceae bacterium]|nr:hypothetical protein [Pyrinomonadaceae bacterium]